MVVYSLSSFKKIFLYNRLNPTTDLTNTPLLENNHQPIVFRVTYIDASLLVVPVEAVGAIRDSEFVPVLPGLRHVAGVARRASQPQRSPAQLVPVAAP